MTTAKTQPTAIILQGDPVLDSIKAGEALVPGLLGMIQSDGTIDGATNALIWDGTLILNRDEVGQGYSGVFATDSAAANLYNAGDEVRFCRPDLGDIFHVWAKGGSADIAFGALLEVIAGASTGTYKGCVQVKNAGVTVFVAMEAIAMSGIAVDTPIKVRRVSS